MEKDRIFFGSEGLTTTSANHIANLAKESYMALEQELSDIKFYSTEIGLLSSDATKVLCTGVSQDYLDTIQDKLHKIAQYKSLIAWLREAIKAKARLVEEAEEMSLNRIADTLGLEYPIQPDTYTRLTSDDVVASWNVKQRNHYYYLDTLCSTIGKYIHPDMTFAKERAKLYKVISEPNRIDGHGRDMIIYTMTPTVTESKVEDTFFALQDRYRTIQAELNSMKHQIELAIQEDDREKTLKEETEASDYANKYRELVAKCNVYKKQRIMEAQALKIIIPDSLKGIFTIVSTMGKKA